MQTLGRKILVLGCGFLTTHLLPHLLPFSKHLILVDRERVERVNYENCILPKGYVNKRKVTALASLIQVLSNVPVTTVHKNIKCVGDILEIHEKYQPDFCFCTFDNVRSRLVARTYALQTETPTLFIGVTEGYIYVDWAESLVIPFTEEEIERVEEEMQRIRDVCSRLEFRGLGVLAAGYAYYAFTRYVEREEKVAFIVSVKDDIKSVRLRRSLRKT